MIDTARPHGYLGKLLATGEQVLRIERQHGFVAVGLIAGALIYVIAVGAVTTLLWVQYGAGRNWLLYGYLLAVLGLPHLWCRYRASSPRRSSTRPWTRSPTCAPSRTCSAASSISAMSRC